MAWFSITLIVLLYVAPVSDASTHNGVTQDWLFVGSEFNYSEGMVIKEPSYNNKSVYYDYFEIMAVGDQSFNYSERTKAYGHLGPQQNRTLPTDASVVISRSNEGGSYPGGTFLLVNRTILAMIAANATLYYNYKNATAPLNISATNYSFAGEEIPAYELKAAEPTYTYASSGSQIYVQVNITLVIDASNGLVLYENEEQSYAEGVHYFTRFTIQGSNFQLISVRQSPEYNLTYFLILVLVFGGISALIYFTRYRGR